MHAINLRYVIPAKKSVQSGITVKNYQRKTMTEIIVQKLIKTVKLSALSDTYIFNFNYSLIS
jgi:hypothetical protein